MIETIPTAEIESLAPMPASVARLAGIVGDPESNAAGIAQVIEFDQALTANVLRLANSAWSGAQRHIDTVRDAVLRLGGARILELAVGQHIAGPMSQRCNGYELGEYELWRHSVAAALAAERLGRFTSKPVPGSAFTAALLHDIGKLVLNRHINRNLLGQIYAMMDERRIPYLQAERELFGTDHAEVGGHVARHWKFPDVLVHAIERHHDPDVEPNPVLDAVHIANATAKLAGVGLGSEQMYMKASTEAAARLGLSSGGLESLCATVVDELARTEALWGVH